MMLNKKEKYFLRCYKNTTKKIINKNPVHLHGLKASMNSRRPSKPNLPSAPKPSKLLAPIGLCQFKSFTVSRIRM